MSSSTADEDRRYEERAPIELKVEYRKLNTFFSDYTKNISKGGTFIKTSKPLKIGTEFLFKLVLPSLDAPLEIKGTVVWIRTTEEAAQLDDDEAPGMGIRFIYEGDQQRGQIEELVAGMMIDSLGERIYSNLLQTER